MADPLFYPGARLPEVRPLTDADIAAMGGQPVLPPQTPRSAVPPFEIVEFTPDAPTPEPAPAKKGDLLGEAKKGAIVGARGAQQMGVALGALANSNVVKASRDSLAAFDRIDRGETLPKPVQGRETLVDLNVENYQQATPAQRAELRAQVLGALTQSKENVEAATAAWREYQAKIQAEQGRVPNLTDVRDTRDFGDWLAFSVGQGSVWMVPMILTALVGGTPALAVAGLTMGAGDLASNTMERAIGPGTNLGGAQAEKYVTPQAAQRVGEALSSEANTIGALSLPYAAAEAVFGPAARVASGAMRETARQAAGQGVKGIAKTAGKEAALGGAEEFGAETTQEFLLSVADRLSPEQTPLLTRENALRWLNAGAAGGASGFAFGGVGGAAGAAVARPKGITERAADAATASGQPTPAQVILQQQAQLQAPASMAAPRLPFEQEAQPIPGTGGWLPAAPPPLAGPDNVPRLPAPAPRLEFMTPTQVPPPAPPVPPAVDVVAGSFIADAQGGVSRETRGEQQAAAAARQRAVDLGETPLRVPADRPPTRAEQAARPAPEGVSGLNERARAALIEAGRLRAEADRLRAIGTPQALATAEKTQARAQQFEQRATEQTRAAASEAGRVHSPDKAGSTPAPATPTQEADALARAREPEVRGALERLAEQVGWAQRGGRLIREDGEDQTSPVTGRTTWVPHADWYPTLPAEARISDPAVARRAVQKAAAGEKMTAKERRFVEALLAVHDEQQAEPEPSAPVLNEEDRRAFEQARAELATDDEAQAERAAIMAEAEGTLVDAAASERDIETLVTHTGADALRALGFTEDEIADAQAPDTRAEGRAAEGGATDEQADAAGAPPGGRAREGAAAAEGQDFGLTAETPGEIRAREAARDRAAEDARHREAAPPPEDFTLTGSDRAADEAAARGQRSLLDQPADKPPHRFVAVNRSAGRWEVLNHGDDIVALGKQNAGILAVKYWDTQQKAWVKPGARGPVKDSNARPQYREVPALDDLADPEQYTRTLAQMRERFKESDDTFTDFDAGVHESHVRAAVALGKPVPAAVLADYQDLKAAQPAEQLEDEQGTLRDRWNNAGRAEREAWLKRAGWRTNNDTLNSVGKQLIAKTWAGILPETRAILERHAQPATTPEAQQPAQDEKTGARDEAAGETAAVRQPPVSANTVFTAEAAERARALLRRKLGQLNAGLDPEIMQAGITLAGYHVERGARTFAAYARAMLDDLGEAVRPYLKSWYMAVRFDPRAADFAADMTPPAEVEAADVETAGEAPTIETAEAPDESDVRPRPDSRERAGDRGDGTDRGADRRSVGERLAARDEDAGGERPAARGDQDAGRARDRGAGDGTRVEPPGASRDQRDVRDRPAAAGVAETPADHAITDADAIGEGGLKQKFRDNLAAIRLAKELEAGGQRASYDQQRVLARYVGWGGLKAVFDPDSASWAKEHAELKDALDADEYAAARRSMLDAHYTSPPVIKGMYQLLRRVGFRGGRVLEPSIGAGHFIGLMPTDLRQGSAFTGVELDRITGLIVKHLYPTQNIIAPRGFQDVRIAAGSYDVALGNPPFGSQTVVDPDHPEWNKLSLHNFFFAKSLYALRPGGLLQMVVSRYLMDARDPAARRMLAQQARLVAAIRLPRTAFKTNANTEVITDILLFQKYGPDDRRDEDPDWLRVDDRTIDGESVAVNRYYTTRASHILGRESMTGSQYRANEYTVEPGDESIADGIARVAATLPQDVYSGSPVTPERLTDVDGLVPDKTKIGGLFALPSGEIAQRLPDVEDKPRFRLLEGLPRATVDRIKGMIAVRDALRDLIRAEIRDAAPAELDRLRAGLNAEYERFRRRFGYLNQLANRRAFADDVDLPLLESLEPEYDPGISVAVAKKRGVPARAAAAKKAPIFERRVLQPYVEPTAAASAKDALLASLNMRGGVDLAYMASLYGRAEDDVVAELKGLIYRDPSEGWQTADAYLTGNVKAKLAAARAAAQTDPAFGENVAALEAVQPPDVAAEDIAVRLGSPWVPDDVILDFARKLLGERVSGTVQYVSAVARWTVRLAGGDRTANESTWGTPDYSAAKILDALLNNRQIVVRRNVGTEREPQWVVDEEATAAAQSKAREVADAFRDWIWDDGARRQRLARIYNDQYNTDRPTTFDGAHLTLPGMSPLLELRPHQKAAIWRGLQDRKLLLDHVVGAGKTFTMVGVAMEARRLGILRKPLFTVPNHLVRQWRDEFYRLYPNANILAATEKDFERANRQRLFARIATGDWDAVIVGHSSMKKIGMPAETEQRILGEMLADVTAAIEELKRERGDRNVLRDMERIKQNLDAKLKRLNSRSGAKDRVVDFAELGVDGLFVDEAHMFKNLFYFSQMKGVAGLGNPAGSARAFDLFVKTRYLQTQRGVRGMTVFATGTPVSNSLVEMYTMQRYLMYDELRRRGIHLLDAWAGIFGNVEQVYEVHPSGSGYRLATRFAKFVNMPELMALYRGFADVVTLKDLRRQAADRGQRFPVPKIRGDRPRVVVAPRSDLQRRFFGVPEFARDEGGEIVFEAKPGELSVAAGAEVKHSGSANSEANAGKFYVVDAQSMTARGGPFDTAAEAEAEIDRMLRTPRVGWNENSILWKFERLRELTKSTDGKINALSITNEARKAGLDYRLIDAAAPDFAGSKVNRAVDEIARVYRAWDEDRGTQLVFCDLSVPASAREKLAREIAQKAAAEAGQEQEAEQEEEAADETATLEEEQEQTVSIDQIEALKSRFSVYDDVRAKLVARGIPADEIAFIHDYDTAAKKQELFQRVRDGRVRVLMGSTEKMGAGMNVQDRLVALHHLDAPWRPSDLEQREGRIVRQGNRLYERDPDGFEVEILRYATEQTYDTRMWQLIEHKANGVEQLRNYTGVAREIDDVSGEAANAAEMKAAASGNPLILEEIKLRNEVRQLEAELVGFQRARARLQESAHYARGADERARPRIENWQRWIDARDAAADRLITAGGQRHEKPAAIEGPLIDAFKRVAGGAAGAREIVGQYRGVSFGLQRERGGEVAVLLQRPDGQEWTPSVYARDDKFSASGYMQRVDNALERLNQMLADERRGITRAADELQKIEAELAKAWPKHDELNEKRRRHTEIAQRLAKAGGAVDMTPPMREELRAALAARGLTMDDAALESRSTAPVFYSELARRIEALSIRAAQPRDWIENINALTKRGVKPDEIEWSGVREWLQMQSGKVTKEQVLDYLRANGVRVEEVVLEDRGRRTDGTVNDPQFGEIEFADNPREETRFASYQLPGGKNYRELLLTLPVRSSAAMDAIARELRGLAWHEGERRAEMQEQMRSAGDSTQFRSPHWGQPNILAHVRFNERTDADGKRVLFIEEVQSDWAQKGRKVGFGRPQGQPKSIADIPGAVVEPNSGSTDERRFPWRVRVGDVAYVGETREDAIRNALVSLSKPEGPPRAPFVEKTDAWVALALKRMIRYAAENGFDRVAWTTGEQQADRYDLSKQIESIGYKQRGELFDVSVWAKGRKAEVLKNQSADVKWLEDNLGKEIAKKIVDGEGRSDMGFKYLEGLDLKVGGEGMRAFYDQIVPKVANELLKKLGGGTRVDRSVIPVAEMSEQDLRQAARQEGNKNVAEVHGFDITAELRERALQGLALFADTRGVLPAFRRLTGEPGAQQALRDALGELAALDVDPGPIDVATEHDPARPDSPMRFDLGSRTVYYNTAFARHSRALDAQAMLEELLHAIDHTGGVRTISAGSPRLAAGGDLHTEVEAALVQSAALRDWLKYPLNAKAHPDLSPTRVQAELFARLGVFYAAHGDVLARIAPKTKAFYDRIFEPRRRGVSGEVQGQDERGRLAALGRPRPAGVESVGRDGHPRGPRPDAAGTGRPRSDDRLADLRRRIAEALGADERGAAVEFERGRRSLESRDRRPDWIRQQPAETQEALRRAGIWTHAAPWAERFDEWKKRWRLRMTQGVADQFAPLKELGYHEYVLARMSRGADNALEALLMHGVPFMDAEGAIDVRYEKGGFLGTLSGLQDEHDRFIAWVVGNRAQRLLAEGREHNFTADQIARLLRLNDGTMPDGQRRAVVYERAATELDRYNRAVMDIAQRAGLIDADSRKVWEKAFYVPFYRVMEGDQTMGPRNYSGLVNQYAFKTLKGGEKELGDPLENMLRNWSHILDASLKNNAAREALQAAERAGVAIEADEQTARAMAKATDNRRGVVSFVDQGVRRWYLVDDLLVLDALRAIGFTGFDSTAMRVMGKFKRWLTLGVTVSPTFRIRNVIRDSLSMIGTNPASYNVLGNVLAGWRGTKEGSPEYAQIIAGGGVMRFGTLLEGDRAAHVKRLIEAGVKDKTILDTPGKVKAAMQAAWDWWQHTGDRAENINRVALYQQLRAQGASHLEASFRARDAIDFSLQGSWGAIRFLTQTVPFFNARLQGLYKLGRGAAEDPKRFAAVTGATALASVLLLLYYRDDDDWKKREDWDRETFWWFKVGDTAYRIPKPFEIGALATVAERMVELLASDEFGGEDFAKSMLALVSQQLSMNPTPQVVMPAIELWANKDAFTGRPIETAGMEKLPKSERAGPNTSAVAQALGAPGVLSPAQIDHLIGGYFGWLGINVVALSDLAARPALGLPPKATARLDDIFVVGDFAKELPAYQSRYVTRLYEHGRQFQEVLAEYKLAAMLRDTEKVKELQAEHGQDIQLGALYERAQQALSKLNAEIRRTQLRDLPADEKRARLDDLYARRNAFAHVIESKARAIRQAAPPRR